jgi:apolipoprotein N-acyltransferase
VTAPTSGGLGVPPSPVPSPPGPTVAPGPPPTGPDIPTRSWSRSRPAPEPEGAEPRRGGVAVPSIVAGIGLALSLPPWGFWILAFPAAGLLWWRLGGLRPRTRLWAGWLAGLGCFVPGLLWARSFTLIGAIALMVIEALFPAVACLVVPSRTVGARALAYPAAMTLAEAARMAWPFGGLPIGGVFLGQAGGPVLGLARLGGPLLLTAAVFAGGVAVAALAQAAVAEARRSGRLGALGLVGSVAVVGVLVATIVADHAPDGGVGRGTVTAAAVQGGGVRGFSKSQVDPAVVLAAQNAATARIDQLDHGHPPELVLWPEDVVSLSSPLDGSPAQAALSRLAVALHATLVVGVTETVSSTTFRNEVVAWGPDGALVARFEKVHRVPFGEYVPYRGLFKHFADLSSVPLDAVPGTGTGLMATPAGPLGALVSFEVFYADRGRSSVRAGAQLLIVPTNTSSYATSQVPTQEIAASEVQAVEQGRDLLQAAPTGFSAVVDHRGQLLSRSTLGKQQVILATLDRRTGETAYVRYGDTPILVLAGVALLGGWALAARAHRRRSPRPTA